MAKKKRKLSVFLLCILLSIPKIIQSRNNCASLSTLRRNSLRQHGIFKFCSNPDSCECKGIFYPRYCHFADDCVGCLHVGQTKLCSQYRGQSTPPVQETCPDDKFMCNGECLYKIWKKECNGECLERPTLCKAVGGEWHCNVSHTPDATDWKCGSRCVDGKPTKEDSNRFDCGGMCKEKVEYKECDNKCMKRDKLCYIDGDPCKVNHQTPSTDWKCGDKCYKAEYKIDYKECNGICMPFYQICTTEETKSTEVQPDEETSIRSETPNNREDKNIKVSENKTTNINKEGLICPEGSFACGSQCLEDHLKFVDCDGVCLDKTTLNNGTCPVKQSHTKLIVGLSVSIFFFLSLVSLTYNAVVTCKKYKAIQPVDRNVAYGITEAPSTFCWVIQHIPFYCSDDMRRAVQEQAEMEIESNPDYGMEMDEYNDPEYNETELVDYNDYYGDSE